MASSKYKAHVIFRRVDSDFMGFDQYIPFSEINDIKVSDESFVIPVDSGMHPTMKQIKSNAHIIYESRYLFFTSKNTHTCRETLIGEIYDSYKAFEFLENYRSNTAKDYYDNSFNLNPTVFIEYIKEYSENISPDTIKLILEFYARFMDRNSGSGFHVQKHGGNIILSYKMNESMKNFTASLILWIFRNTNIMVDCLKNFSSVEKVYFGNLLTYLMKGFLKNPGWVNTSNPSIPMSLFCYNLLKNGDSGYIDPKIIGGPVEFSIRASTPYTIFSYVKDVLIPNVNREDLDSLYEVIDTDNDFYRLIKYTYSLLENTLNKYSKLKIKNNYEEREEL